MANKKTSVLLAGLAAGAYAYFKKPENRDKVMDAINNTKGKMNDYVETQKKNSQNEMNDTTDTATSDTSAFTASDDTVASPSENTTEYSSSYETTTNPSENTTEFSSSYGTTTNPSESTTEFSSSYETTTNPSESTTEFSSSYETTTNPSENTTEYSSSYGTSSQQVDADNSVTGDVDKDYHLEEKDMVSEGAMTTVQYHNEDAQNRLDTKEQNYFIDENAEVQDQSDENISLNVDGTDSSYNRYSDQNPN